MRIGIDAAEISGSLINVVNRIFKAATVKDIKGEMQLFLQFAINRIRALSDGGGVLDIAKAYIEQYYMMDLGLIVRFIKRSRTPSPYSSFLRLTAIIRSWLNCSDSEAPSSPYTGTDCL